MNTKPFYLSLTITAALVHLFITLAALFGIDLGDQTDAITKTIEQLSLAAGSLLATFSTVVGRIRAQKQITLGRAPSSAAAPLLALVAAGIVFTLSGCATDSAISANGLPSATGTTSTTNNLTTIAYTVANYLQTLNNGSTIPTVDQALTATHNSGDIATVNLVASLVGQVAAAVVAAHNAGANATQTQAVVNTVLAPAAVAQTAANVAATTPAIAGN
jgi:hypothetical protein